MEEVVGAVGVVVGVEVEEVLHPVSVEERLVYGMQNTHRSEKKREKGTLEIERLYLYACTMKTIYVDWWRKSI